MSQKNKDFHIELNGIANMHLMIDVADGPQVNKALHTALKEQLDLLERYMLAVAKAAREGAAPPAWHEIRANKGIFPTLREQR